MGRYFDMAGAPIGMMEWAAAMEDVEGRIVGKTAVGDAQVSTVWIGLDHQFGDGEPLIFETMIFGGDHDGEEWRYSSREQAVEGHATAVALLNSEKP